MTLALLSGYPDPSQPCVTSYLAAGRAELSVRTLRNLVSKAANLLVDGLDLAVGASLSVDAQAHWQQPVWALAGWTAGLKVGARLPGEVAARVVGPAELAERARSDWEADELLAVPADVFGLPIPGGVPPGVIDVGAELRGYGDAWVGRPAASPPALLLSATPGTEVAWEDALTLAGELARAWDLAPGGRLLVEAGLGDPDTALLAATLVPLTRQAAVVMVAPDAAIGPDLLSIERITAVAGKAPREQPLI